MKRQKVYKKGKDTINTEYDNFSFDLLNNVLDNVAERGEKLIDNRYNGTVFNKLGRRYLNVCLNSKNHAPNLIEIFAHDKQ